MRIENKESRLRASCSISYNAYVDLIPLDSENGPDGLLGRTSCPIIITQKAKDAAKVKVPINPVWPIEY